MLKFVLVAALAAVAVALVVAAFRKKGDKKKSTQAPEPNLLDLKIQDAAPGDVISIRGAGDEFEDLEFTVDRRHRYQCGASSWQEISGRYKSRRVHVEWHDEDELEVSLCSKTKMKLSEVKLSEDDLVRMDESPSDAHSFEYDGATWRYDSSQEITFFENGAGSGEGFYNWDFEAGDGERRLSVEKWEGEPFEVSLSQLVSPDDISVFR